MSDTTATAGVDTQTVLSTLRPKNCTLRASTIKVDLFRKDSTTGQADGYQRNPDALFVKMLGKMKLNFIPAMYEPLTVAEWQGEYFAIDGNARLSFSQEVAKAPTKFPTAFGYFTDVAEEAGAVLTLNGAVDPLIECRVVMDCPPMAQAWLFVRLNEDRRNVPWMSRHQANLFQKLPVAETIEEVVTTLGLRVERSTQKGSITAVQALYSTILHPSKKAVTDTFSAEELKVGADLLSDVLRIANESFSLPHVNAADRQYCFSDRMLDALAFLFSEFTPAELDRDEAIACFSKVLARDLINRAAKVTSAHGSNNVSALATVLAKEFNKATPENPNGRFLRLSRLDPTKRKEAASRQRKAAKAKEKAKAAKTKP